MSRYAEALQTRGADGDIESDLDWVEAGKPDYLITQAGRAMGLARAAIARGRPGPASTRWSASAWASPSRSP